MKFTIEDIRSCWTSSEAYLLELLNDEYKLEDLRNNLTSLIGTEFDLRKQKDKLNDELIKLQKENQNEQI